MTNVLQYFKERFPPLLAIFLSVGYATYLVGLCALIGGKVENLPLAILLVSISFLCLLLRQRILDEFKDFKHDKTNYPNRPYQRGLITKKQLITIGIFAFVGELTPIFFISPTSLLYYIPVLIFSLLMAKEFFISKWLKSHQTAYFISHQSVYILLAIWAYATFQVKFSVHAILATIAIICVMAGAEIVRKYTIRKDKRGKPVNDTYITMWGETGARTTLEFMLSIPGIAIAIITQNLAPCLVALSGVIAIEVFSRKRFYTRLIAGILFIIQAGLIIIL